MTVFNASIARRSLVTAGTCAVAAAAASPLAAFAAEALAPTPAWDIEADVVVVGSGAAGISAAVAAIAVDVMNQPGSVCYPVTDGHIVPSQLQMGGSVEAMEQWAADGHVARGETLEELAANMEELFGTPADAVLATLNRYNEFCAAGSDDDFGKDPHYLTPYDQPPFYAGPAETCRYLYTHGGLDTDLQAQVQGIDGVPIAGLYAAGMCTGGHLGTDTISGNWQLDAVVFGRIAGANAAAAAR